MDKADIITCREEGRLIAQHHAAVLGCELHQPRRKNDLVPVHGELLPNGTAHGADERLPGRDADRRLDALKAQRLPNLQGGEQRAIRLVLVGEMGPEDQFHHTALVIDGEAMDASLQLRHDALHCDDGRVDLVAIEIARVHEAANPEIDKENAGLHDTDCPASHGLFA